MAGLRTDFHSGDVIDGRFEVVKRLGAGSMGMVYLCLHRGLGGKRVAVKVLFPDFVNDEVQYTRFINEINAAHEVNHPHVVRAFDAFTDGETVAYYMEYVAGGDLTQLIRPNNPVDIGEIVRLLMQMCSGVQSIHEAGIIHRDLKPENILLTLDRDVKITDFGIAKSQSVSKLTEHGGVVGTLAYVSPEYLEIGKVDYRSDVYALGLLGYELTVGRSPFDNDNMLSL